MGYPTRRTGRLVCLALALVAAGCASAPRQADKAAPAAVAPAASAPVFTGSLAAAPSEYRIGPADILEVTVFDVPNLSRVAQVNSSGRIALPLIGTVAAAGKSVAALEAEITAALAATYLQSPQVSVFLKEAASQRVTVGGAVRQPGVFPVTGEVTLLQMIALARGLDPVADARNVLVFRTLGGQRTAARFDFAAISAGKAEDPAIRAGDIVIVEESGAKAAWRNITQALPVISIFSPLL